MEKEIWKDIDGFEGRYQVSTLGRVKSLKRKRKCKSGSIAEVRERILKGGIINKSYLTVTFSINSIVITRTVHSLVAEAFLNHKSGNKYVVINHKNFIKTDNRLCNLEIVSARENTNKKHLKSSSKYTGVYFQKHSGKWIATITINKKKVYLGIFKKEIDASIAYKNALEKNEINKPKIIIMTNNLKAARIKVGVSRYKMANDLNIVYGTLKNWENSETLSPDKMKICADYLDVDVNEIFKL